MEYKDTKYLNLESTLNAIGKAAFVNFYYEFKDASMPADELAEKIFRESPKARSNRQSFRIPRARHIFEIGKEIEALEIIVNSPKVEAAAREKAKVILQNEKQSQLNVDEFEKEQRFISKLNNSVPYLDDNEIEYDNTPKPPKAGIDTKAHKYPRSKTVAQRALAKAAYLCECDASHDTFKRKNCSKNYTEPHHLIPLCAAKDFPDIDLDREQNVVSLCSNCHNWLHYGDETDVILKPLYEARKELLKAIGAEITYEQLKSYYK